LIYNIILIYNGNNIIELEKIGNEYEIIYDEFGKKNLVNQSMKNLINIGF